MSQCKELSIKCSTNQFIMGYLTLFKCYIATAIFEIVNHSIFGSQISPTFSDRLVNSHTHQVYLRE